MRPLSRLYGLVALLLLALIALEPRVAAAEERVALVVGNGAYKNVPPLRNPTNDAADMAASLERLGFAVTLVQDSGFDDLRRALIGFGAKARDADMAVVFFAGHGMEVAGENWAIPVDASLTSDSDVENEAIGLKSLSLAVSGARSLGLVILDACRNNPFGARMQRTTRTRAVSRGLAPIEPTGNVLVAFAARDGTTATDGDGRNSPFTAALLHNLEIPGLEIDFLLRNVRDDVLRATGGDQQPFAYGSLSREAIYLKPAAVPADGQAAATPAPGADEVAWPYLAGTTDAAVILRYVAQFPSSRHRAEADQRLAVLQAAPVVPPQQPLATAEPAASARQPSVATDDQTAVARQFNASAPQVETAWSLLKTSTDPGLLKRFTAEFPSRERRTVTAALNGIGSTSGVLRQLHIEEIHAVLADYGRFVQHPTYGEVWVPTVTPTGWHPYEPCHWVKTRRLDWFYLDRTPWGAIVHHYGRWAHDIALGWIWVPGVDFSPGWVLWQVTPQQVGWAPMPPDQDLRTISAEQFNKADFWTFMDRSTFVQGCGPVVPAATVLANAVFVRDVRLVDGIPVFVLPVAPPDAPLDIDVAFDPWPASTLTQTLVNWNTVWAATPPFCPAPVKPIPVSLPMPPKLKLPPPPAPKPQPKPKQQAQQKKPAPAPVAQGPRRRQAPVYTQDEPVVTYRQPQPYYPSAIVRPMAPLGGFGFGGGLGGLGGFGGGRGYGGGGYSGSRPSSTVTPRIRY